MMSTRRDQHAELPKDPAQSIEACGARGDPRRAEAMEGGQRLLRLRLHGHRTKVVVPERLEQPFGIRAIRLVAENVWASGMRWNEHDLMPSVLCLPRPVVR
jgi:hypothetical protein